MEETSSTFITETLKLHYSEAYLGPYQAYVMGFFVKVVNG